MLEHFRGHAQYFLVKPAERLVPAVVGNEFVEFVGQPSNLASSPQVEGVTVVYYSK